MRRTVVAPARLRPAVLLATCAAGAACVAFMPTAAQAQRLELRVRAGFAAASELARDDIATGILRQAIGRPMDGTVSLESAPGPVLGVGARLPLRPGLSADLMLDVTHSSLRVREDAGTRRMQELEVLQGSAGLSRALAGGVEVGAGIAIVHYLTPREGVFSEGSRPSPGVEGRLGWRPPLFDERVSLAGIAQLHRFGTARLRAGGAADGNVARLSVAAHVRLSGGAR